MAREVPLGEEVAQDRLRKGGRVPRANRLESGDAAHEIEGGSNGYLITIRSRMG